MKKESCAVVIPLSLEFAMQQFPDHKEILKRLYRQDEAFISLCQDYQDCVRALEYWRNTRTDKKNRPEHCREYKALCKELKEEIEKWLAERDRRD